MPGVATVFEDSAQPLRGGCEMRNTRAASSYPKCRHAIRPQ